LEKRHPQCTLPVSGKWQRKFGRSINVGKQLKMSNKLFLDPLSWINTPTINHLTSNNLLERMAAILKKSLPAFFLTNEGEWVTASGDHEGRLC